MSGEGESHRQVLVRSIRGPVSVVEASDSSETLFEFCKRIQLQVEGIDSDELQVSLFHGRRCLVPARSKQLQKRPRNNISSDTASFSTLDRDVIRSNDLTITENCNTFHKNVAKSVQMPQGDDVEYQVMKSRSWLERTTVGEAGVEHGSVLQTMLCIAGGKGGFGSNLRAAGKLKLVDNVDACRDLQGRRVRQKTAMEKLEKWKEEEHERELEKIALKHLREVERKNRRGAEIEVDVQNVRKEKKKALRGIKSAVSEGLARDGGPTASEKEESSDQKLQKTVPSKFALFDDDESEYASSTSSDDE